MKSVVGLEAALVQPPAEYPGNFFEGTRFATECFVYFQSDFSNLFFSVHILLRTLSMKLNIKKGDIEHLL